jgi:hypothetical protein
VPEIVEANLRQLCFLPRACPFPPNPRNDALARNAGLEYKLSRRDRLRPHHHQDILCVGTEPHSARLTTFGFAQLDVFRMHRFPFEVDDFAAARGRAFEQAVIEMIGAVKNTSNIGGAIPDVYAPGQFMLEIKDVQYLYRTTQVATYIADAQAEGTPLYIMVSPSTQVAGTVAAGVAETGGEIAVADVATGTVVSLATGETLLDILPFLILL